MYTCSEMSALRPVLEQWQKDGDNIGLVPTMGGLHAGHLALLASARAECKRVVCSIFVNPEQFDKKNDYISYPRSLSVDAKKAEKAGCDLLFCPTVEQMYPETPQMRLDFGALSETMEGSDRVGHFSGVGLVLSRLFHMLLPTYAYFGQKDWQQYLVVDRLVRDLNFGVTLRAVPTLREADGLAFSSRNVLLSPLQRQKAPCLYAALCEGREALRTGRTPEEARAEGMARLEQVEGLELHYFKIVDTYTLEDVNYIAQHKSVSLLVAAQLQALRLIDNVHFAPVATSFELNMS